MSNKTLYLSDELYSYMLSVSLREPKILRRLREETSHDSMANMQISPEQGQFMSLLIKLMGATKALEVGVYTGHSSLCIALALPSQGKLIACDVNREWTAIALRYWQKAGVSKKIDLHFAPAIETMNKLLADNRANTFDFVFIDADKINYDGYYERALDLLRPGGLIAIDNVFWSGQVVDSHIVDEDTVALRYLNEKLHRDNRIELSLVPIGDGLSMALKRR